MLSDKKDAGGSKLFGQVIILTLALAVCLVSAQGQAASAGTAKTSANAPKAGSYFPLAEVKAGLIGVARSVFRGTVAEECQVEILGVLPGAVGPKQDLIIGKLSGANAERVGVFAGMSGSPVFIDGKLVGAISYSFPFSKEPIAGITPIQQMIDIFEMRGVSAPRAMEPRSITFAELKSTDIKSLLPASNRALASVLASGDPNLAAVYGQQFRPIATPLSFSGISPAALNEFLPQLHSLGLMPVAAAGARSEIKPMAKASKNTLIGGDSVSMHLSRGDYSLASSGTVTLRDGNRVYAYGHPFLSLGPTDFPMAVSSVVTVVPNLNNSFKLAIPGDMVGSMKQDRATGVYGEIGNEPKLIPVKINVQTSRNQKEAYNFEVVKDSFLTPLLLSITVYNSLLANERAIGDSTVALKGKVGIKGEDAIRLDRRFSAGNALPATAGSVAIPVSVLFNSGFENFDVTGVEIDAVVTDGRKTAELERISLDRNEVRAGQTFEVTSYLRTDSGRVVAQRIPVKIPADTPTGTMLVTVGDGNSVERLSATQAFVPKTIGELIATMNKIKKNDRLYALTHRLTNGAVIGASEMPNLPPSVLATLNNDRSSGGFTPTVLTMLSEQEVPPSEYVVSGQQALTIEVVR
jgi:hypothetical protein